MFNPRGKFKPNWVRSYVINTVMSGGAVNLMNLDGEELVRLINPDRLCKY